MKSSHQAYFDCWWILIEVVKTSRNIACTILMIHLLWCGSYCTLYGSVFFFYYKMRNLEGLVLNELCLHALSFKEKKQYHKFNYIIFLAVFIMKLPQDMSIIHLSIYMSKDRTLEQRRQNLNIEKFTHVKLNFFTLNDGKGDSSSPYCSMLPESLHSQYNAYFNIWNICGSNASRQLFDLSPWLLLMIILPAQWSIILKQALVV